MDAPTFRVGAEMWESLAPAAIWVGVDDTDVQRLGHAIPKPAIVDGTGDVAACGDLLGGNHHSTAACTSLRRPACATPPAYAFVRFVIACRMAWSMT